MCVRVCRLVFFFLEKDNTTLSQPKRRYKTMKINEKQKAEVIMDYSLGKKVTEIAKKFGVSSTAICKIIKKYKSEEHTDKVNIDQKEIARTIYHRATDLLKEKIDKATASELLKVIEYYDIKYNFAEENNADKVTAISVTVEDGTEN